MNEISNILFKEIPEIAYDLISRILPGGLVVAALIESRSVLGITVDTLEGELGRAQFIFLVLAYAAGLAVSAFAHICHFVAWPLVIRKVLRKGDVDAKIVASFQALAPGASIEFTDNPFTATAILGRAHELIRALDKNGTPVTMKLFAESALLYNLAVAIFIVWLLKCFSPAILIIYSVFFLGAGILRSVRTWYRYENILFALVSVKKT